MKIKEEQKEKAVKVQAVVNKDDYRIHYLKSLISTDKSKFKISVDMDRYTSDMVVGAWYGSSLMDSAVNAIKEEAEKLIKKFENEAIN